MADNVTELSSRERASLGIESLVSMIERNIEVGVWKPGAKLPTERELEKQLGLSRNTLRRGLRRLEDQGRIVRHVGRGSFIADVSANGADVPAAVSQGQAYANGEAGNAIDSLLHKILDASPMDLMEVRLLLEPKAAELAALRASSSSLEFMTECVSKMLHADSTAEYEHWDGMLHVTILSASRNELLTALYEALNSVRTQPEWIRIKTRSLRPERRALYQQQHEKIVGALMDRNPEAAYDAVDEHLRAVRDNLLSG